ncbi:MAG: LysM peptidoglycan-binding domain-containing protein [Paramuribaculum sp.]|nr:LysM peptidoglycan-binding domain-containing protein [Paramuribaculum sp.]
MILRSILLAGAMASCLIAGAQVDNLPRKNINGTSYYYYEVQPKETIYSISHKLGISRAEIERCNPAVADGLKAGQVLYFPVEGDSPARTHIVKAKETVYGISKLYGITPSQLTAWNPSAVDGIRTGQILYVSEPVVSAAPVADVKPAEAARRSHVIGEGESLYRIAVNNGTTVDAILAENPGLERDHYQAGTLIYLPVSAAASAPALVDLVQSPKPRSVEAESVQPESPEKPRTHTVRDGETFYSIAHTHGITVEELEKANPEVGLLSKGTVLVIPDAATPFVPAESRNELAGAVNSADSADETEYAPATIDIALTLPLMLSMNEQPRQAQLYTEFYKGFLVGVDSMRRCGSPINLQVYDTSGSSDTLRSILSNPALKAAKVIIAPDNEAQLAMLGEYGAANGIDVLNLFVVKDMSYLTNPHLMQGNIPHSAMYSKAIEGMLTRFGTYTPVILSRVDGPDDKAEYISALKRTLSARGVSYKEIVYESSLKDADLDSLDVTGMYAFIPESGKQAELNRVLPAIIKFKNRTTQADPVRVFGYPEWTTFRGETLLNMHKVNTIVYSRFFTVPEDPAVKAVENKYRDWYGVPMANFVPRQGLFGYDTAMFLINALRSGNAGSELPAKWFGVQNGFDFIRVGQGGGLVNDELYFINYRPSGLIDKYSL